MSGAMRGLSGVATGVSGVGAGVSGGVVSVSGALFSVSVPCSLRLRFPDLFEVVLVDLVEEGAA